MLNAQFPISNAQVWEAAAKSPDGALFLVRWYAELVEWGKLLVRSLSGAEVNEQASDWAEGEAGGEDVSG